MRTDVEAEALNIDRPVDDGTGEKNALNWDMSVQAPIRLCPRVSRTTLLRSDFRAESHCTSNNIDYANFVRHAFVFNRIRNSLSSSQDRANEESP
jgi:hypothetical protein